MTYVITRGCCTDASCVTVCPVDCIHPRPGEVDYGTTEILYVDADVCIDCGACADACPVKAIKPADMLKSDELVFLDINAAFYRDRPPVEPNHEHTWDRMGPTRTGKPLQVAIVGTGPSASYTTRTLLLSTDTRVTILDRAVMAGGFVRSAVAPDHGGTKKFIGTFDWLHRHPRAAMYMNVAVGKDISHEELLKFHDAVIYGVGADQERPLGVPGADLPSVYSAHDVVRWYNADEFVRPNDITVKSGRVVIIGNGNVALDIARILLTDPAKLRSTEISHDALAEIARADVNEVIILGRRGPADASFTRPELLTMGAGIDVEIHKDPQTLEDLNAAAPGSKAAVLTNLPTFTGNLAGEPAPGKRAVFLFGSSLRAVNGSNGVETVAIRMTEADIDIPAGTVVVSIGHRGSPIAGLPFDDQTGTVPNEQGRVVDPVTGEPVRGAYVVGWIKRGAQGGIGINRGDSQETILTLLNDLNDPAVRSTVGSVRAFGRFLRRRVPHHVTRRVMRRIDVAERMAGEPEGRPRQKQASSTNR